MAFAKWTRRRRITLAGVTVLAVLGVSCSSTRIIDEVKMQEFIETDLARQLGEPISDAVCPQLRDPEQGQTFECTGAVDGKSVRFAGSVTDADEGLVFLENADAILPVADVELVIVNEFEAQLGFGLEADCGDARVLVEPPGGIFHCEIRSEFGDEGTVRVDVLDSEGNIVFEIE